MNYNYIAPYYDFLSRLCFLNRQQKAHDPILKYLKPNERILWIGGGSGWFLNEIDQLNIPIEIDYIEFSSVMINKAKTRKLNHLKVNFYEEDIFKFLYNRQYDGVISAFIFDHFTEENCAELFYKIEPQLKKNGMWFYVDFNQNQTAFQRILTYAMVKFFAIVAGHKSKDFPKIEYLFSDYNLIDEVFYFGNYITSKIYKK